MNPNTSEAGWSLVITEFQGQVEPLAQAVLEAFGRPGFPALSFTFRSKRAEYLPMEVAAELNLEDARRAAALLEGAGAAVALFQTAEVSNVRFRAGEVWPDRCAQGWSFTRVDGLICTLSPLNARENVEAMRRADASRPGWHLERGLNHQHPNHDCSTRKALRDAVDMGAEMAAALREAYPEREFVVAMYLGEDVVSFYQAEEGAPGLAEPMGPLTRGDSPWVREPEKSWCNACGQGQGYTLRPEPDPEFPMVEWAECRACGTEMVVQQREVYFRVGPGRPTELRVRGYLPQPPAGGWRTAARLPLDG